MSACTLTHAPPHKNSSVALPIAHPKQIPLAPTIRSLGTVGTARLSQGAAERPWPLRHKGTRETIFLLGFSVDKAKYYQECYSPRV